MKLKIEKLVPKATTPLREDFLQLRKITLIFTNQHLLAPILMEK